MGPRASDEGRPFLRWVGGKRHIVRQLVPCLPPDVAERFYREPFLGGASLFFALRPDRACLSDANHDLMSCYEYVATRPDLVWAYLRRHAASTCRDYYYQVRTRYNRSSPSAAQAARFIYLNKTCFNGIFRVNTSGEFNVPYGCREPPLLPTLAELRAAAVGLRQAELVCRRFEEALAQACPGDFVYLDPPYPPLNGVANFTHYTPDRFGERDQRRLAELVREADSRGCVLMMTNADTPLVRELYRGYYLAELSVVRYVTCKSRKHRASELVITNYPPHRG